MKYSLIFMFILLVLCAAASAGATQKDFQAEAAGLKSMDAKAALSLANQWRWTRPDITAYVTARELVLNSRTNGY